MTEQILPQPNAHQLESDNLPRSKAQKNPLKFLWNTIKAVGNDIQDAPLKASAAATAFVYTQKVDRLRDPFVWLADNTVDKLNQGSLEFQEGLPNSIQAGVEAGGIFGASYFAIGMAGYAGARWMPKTREQITSQIPRLEPVARHATRGNGYINKAAIGLTIGSVAEGCLTAIDGEDMREAAKNVSKVSAAAASVTVPLVIGFDAATDALIRNGHYDAAETLADVATSRLTWLGLMVGATVATYKHNTKIAQGKVS